MLPTYILTLFETSVNIFASNKSIFLIENLLTGGTTIKRNIFVMAKTIFHTNATHLQSHVFLVLVLFMYEILSFRISSQSKYVNVFLLSQQNRRRRNFYLNRVAIFSFKRGRNICELHVINFLDPTPTELDTLP